MSGSSTSTAALTVQRGLTLAMRAAGVVDAYNDPQPADLADAQTLFGAMLGQWNQMRFLVPNELDLPCLSTGALTYSVQPGGDFDTPRPDRILSAYARLIMASSQVTTLGPFDPAQLDPAVFSTGASGNISQPLAIDFPLSVIQSREDWNSICLKGLSTFPLAVFYEASVAAPLLHVWPVPQAGRYEIHISVKDVLTAGSALTDPITTPPEYLEALIWNMAGRLRPFYGMAPEPTITALARASLATIRASNTQIPTLDLPSAVQPLAGIMGGVPGLWFGGFFGGGSDAPGSGAGSRPLPPAPVPTHVSSVFNADFR